MITINFGSEERPDGDIVFDPVGRGFLAFVVPSAKPIT